MQGGLRGRTVKAERPPAAQIDAFGAGKPAISRFWKLGARQARNLGMGT